MCGELLDFTIEYSWRTAFIPKLPNKNNLRFLE